MHMYTTWCVGVALGVSCQGWLVRRELSCCGGYVHVCTRCVSMALGVSCQGWLVRRALVLQWVCARVYYLVCGCGSIVFLSEAADFERSLFLRWVCARV